MVEAYDKQLLNFDAVFDSDGEELSAFPAEPSVCAVLATE